MAKDQVFKVRLTADERRRLDALARDLPASASTVLRILVKRAYEELRARENQALLEASR